MISLLYNYLLWIIRLILHKKRLHIVIILLIIALLWFCIHFIIWAIIANEHHCKFASFNPTSDINGPLYQLYVNSIAIQENNGEALFMSTVAEFSIINNNDDIGLSRQQQQQQQIPHHSPSKQEDMMVDENCSLSEQMLAAYPECMAKLKWMRNSWRTHQCYADYGVDGSFCSFVIYLSEVEHYCPILERRRRQQSISNAANEHHHHHQAQVRRNVSDLWELMYDSNVNYEFIKSRISRLWSKWLNAYDENLLRWPKSLFNRRQLNVIIHMGFLSKEAGFKFGEKASAGGPLGELVQWSDLIATLYILGHNLLISTECDTFKKNLAHFSNLTPCDIGSHKNLDLIFTDIVGVRYMRRKMREFYLHNKCLLRVLDSFGTHAEFNLASYFQAHKTALGGRSNPWGGSALNLQQFMTMYPHTDDNTFLGFVVETHNVNESSSRTNHTLVYGKEMYMWSGSEQLLNKVSLLSQLHATIADASNISGWPVINHGLLSGFDLHSLLRRVKIFLGLGFPLEGPAPLEAIANGAVFINPIFKPPKSRRSYSFFADKPTLRELSSQNPYVERFIGRPHVISVDIGNWSEVENAIRDALASNPQPYLPFEFTASGMLQRVNVLISNQNFCSKSSNYPPRQIARIIFADKWKSCEQTCSENGLVCERSFFDIVNEESVVNRSANCKTIERIPSPLAPYECVQQLESLLYSCASVPQNDSSIKRICPCRDFIHGQIALCSICF